MKPICKACRLPIKPQDINLEMAIAKCAACGEVFSILDGLEGDNTIPQMPVALPVPKPKRFVVEEFGSELTIRYRWFTPSLFLLVLFCLFWDAFMATWYGIAITMILSGEIAGWFMALFGLLHLAVGIGITYWTLASFINRTEIQVSGGDLTVWHGPIRCGSVQRIPTSDIKQLYCCDRMRTGRGSQFSNIYELNALKLDGSKVTLLGGLVEPEEALFLEERLEQRLGIPPQPVPGELRR